MGRRHRGETLTEVYSKLDNVKRSNANIFTGSVNWQPLIELASVVVHPLRVTFSMFAYCDTIWLGVIAPQIDAFVSARPNWGPCRVEKEPTWIDVQDLHSAVLAVQGPLLDQIQRHFHIVAWQNQKLYELANPTWAPMDSSGLDFTTNIGMTNISGKFMESDQAKQCHRDGDTALAAQVSQR